MTATESPMTSCCGQTRCDCNPSTAPTPLAVDDRDLAALCKALAHPARIAILRRLLAADTCVFGTLATWFRWPHPPSRSIWHSCAPPVWSGNGMTGPTAAIAWKPSGSPPFAR